MAEYEVQEEWLESLPSLHQIIFLTALGHALTVVGRDSYVPQSEELEYPAHLRRINEIQHRVTAYAYDLLTNEPIGSFRRFIAHLVLKQSDQRMLENMQWAWEMAKEKLLRAAAQGAMQQ